MRLKNIGEILQLNCVFCNKLNIHLIIYKKHIDTVTRCKSCEEITLILDEEFIENYLKSYS
jgi:transcription elongation factor Elf1